MFPFIEWWGLKIPTFPVLLLLAVFVTLITYVLSPRYDKTYLWDFVKKVLPMAIGAVIGVRLLSAITLIPLLDQHFWYNLLFGGAVFYGGIIGSFLALAIVCAVKKQPFLEYTDVFVSLFPLGHAIGRLGCFFNGCCYGCRYDGIFAVSYPVNGEWVSVFPTWFAEMLFCVVLFLFFQCVYRTQIRGRRTAVYLIAYAVYRYTIEYVRGDEMRGTFGPFTTSQAISIVMVLTGIAVLVYANKTKKENYLIIKECEIL